MHPGTRCPPSKGDVGVWARWWCRREGGRHGPGVDGPQGAGPRPVCSATASLLFQDPGFDASLFGGTPPSNQDPTREAATNTALASLHGVADRTAKTLGGLTGDDVSSKVDVQAQGEANLVSVTATDSSPQFAARLANTYAEQFVGLRRQADRAKIHDAARLAERRYSSLSPAEQQSREGRLLRKQIGRLKALGAAQTGNAELAQRANVPDSPSSPKPVRNTVLGVTVGLMLGLGLAFLFERLDRRLWDRDELEESFGLPVLGMIPDSKAFAGNGRSEELPPLESEAFRMLRGRLRYFDVDRKVSSVLVTSGAARDGKSTVAWNLALTAASVGSKTILLECDFHQPTLATRRGLRPVPGLSELLTGQTDLVVQHVSVANSSNGEEPDRQLDAVVAGTRPPNPLELMESDEMAALIAHLTNEYDLVVIDTPPVTLVSDVIPLLRLVSGVIVVGEPGRTKRESATGASRAARQPGCAGARRGREQGEDPLRLWLRLLPPGRSGRPPDRRSLLTPLAERLRSGAFALYPAGSSSTSPSTRAATFPTPRAWSRPLCSWALPHGSCSPRSRSPDSPGRWPWRRGRSPPMPCGSSPRPSGQTPPPGR